jgi:hypothetical protein
LDLVALVAQEPFLSLEVTATHQSFQLLQHWAAVAAVAPITVLA